MKASTWATGVVGLAMGVLAMLPTCVAAQGLGWTVAATALLDASFTFETPVGPGLTGEVELRRERDLSFAGIATFARTDFPVGPDDLHRNHGMAAVAARWMQESDRPTVGFLLGVGAVIWDDVSETDPSFRSSANGASLLLAGVELRIPTADSFGVTISVRDAITGLVNAVADPEERDVEHRFLISVGIYGR